MLGRARFALGAEGAQVTLGGRKAKSNASGVATFN